jgi:hypothetical protein
MFNTCSEVIGWMPTVLWKHFAKSFTEIYQSNMNKMNTVFSHYLIHSPFSDTNFIEIFYLSLTEIL